MELESYNPANMRLSADQLTLIEKARVAITPINRTFEMRLPGGSVTNPIAAAWIYGGPGKLFLDFKAHSPHIPNSGYADLGPSLALSHDLFQGTEFTPEVLLQIEESFAAFDAYCREEN